MRFEPRKLTRAAQTRPHSAELQQEKDGHVSYIKTEH